MMVDQDGVILPRLRVRDGVRRGAVFGVIGVVPLAVAALSIGDHHDREEFLSVVGGVFLLFGALLLVIGAFFWWASAGEVRRWRDWRTITGQTGAVTVVAPMCLRVGMLLLVLGPAALGLYHVVDDAPYGSWLYSH
jgi:hypothetical protein